MMAKRKPQIAPGPAVTEGKDDDDFTLTAALYHDAVYYYGSALDADSNNDHYASDRFKRSAILAAFSFFEAQLNQIAFAYAETHEDVLGQIERDVLEEMETVMDDRGDIIRKQKFYRTESRFCFLAYFLSGVDFDRSGELWNEFRAARKLRDAWMHPKPPFDTWSLTLADVYNTVIVVRAMFMKLAEMMNSNPPLWLRHVDDILSDTDSIPDENAG